MKLMNQQVIKNSKGVKSLQKKILNEIRNT